MTDMISCEEVFEANGDEWLNEEMEEPPTLECEGCGEVWFASQAGENGRIEWCRKCYKNDPYCV
jgi:formylmethanofuran dehydrogenase subunit E